MQGVGVPARNTVGETIERVRRALSETTSEVQLESELDAHLSALREHYKQHPDDFSPDHIRYLQGVRDLLETVRSFSEVVEDLPLVADADDARESLADLYTIARGLQNTGVLARVLREIRGLLERIPGLADSGARRREQRRKDLEARAAPCRCGLRMVIRAGPYSDFWGCDNFPECWNKRPLTADESRYLEEGK